MNSTTDEGFSFETCNLIDIVLISIAVFEQLISFSPDPYPKSTIQLIIYCIYKLLTITKKKKDISPLNHIQENNLSTSDVKSIGTLYSIQIEPFNKL